MKRGFCVALGLLLGLCPAGVVGEAAWRHIPQEEARAILETETEITLLDVRREDEYSQGHIPGAVCVPVETIGAGTEERLPDKERTLLVYCRSGRRSVQAAEKLAALGYADIREFGGILDWTGPVVTGGEPGTYPRPALRLAIGGTPLRVEWEDNTSVAALRAMAAREPLTVEMSMYGGFEQVGGLGQALPSEDARTAARPGDIVLYSGDRIVVFYGSNTWAYTRLGHVADRTEAEMAALLGEGDVVLTLRTAACEPAELSFDSFDGGGPEYTVAVRDLAIVSCGEGRSYGNEDHGEIDGASYTVTLTFTGLASGETEATVSARSPIDEGWDAVYSVFVDEGLNVFLRRAPELESFVFYRGGYTAPRGFAVTREDGAYWIAFNDGDAVYMPGEAVGALYAAIGEYGLAAWDGFHGNDPYVLDGEGFTLEYALSDGTRVHASGENAFPPGYFAAAGALEELLRAAAGLE